MTRRLVAVLAGFTLVAPGDLLAVAHAAEVVEPVNIAEASANLDRVLKVRIDEIEAGAKQLHRSLTTLHRQHLLDRVVPQLRAMLADGHARFEDAQREPYHFAREEKAREAGALYQSVMLGSALVVLELDLALVSDWADEQGQYSLQLARQLRDYDEDMRPLLEAMQNSEGALPAPVLADAVTKYQKWALFLDRWVQSIKAGAKLSAEVIAVADVLMLAASAYEAAQALPRVGDPPAVLGIASGGTVVAARMEPAVLTKTFAAIRDLVALGAMDGAVVVAMASMKGGQGVKTPALQPPSVPSVTGTASGGSRPARGEIRWVDENSTMSPAAKQYQAGAEGARSNATTKSLQAPELSYRAPDGTEQVVRFDGADIKKRVLIDRKVSVTTFPKSKYQALRQSTALKQNGFTGRWEVVSEAEALRAKRMLQALNIDNIDVAVVAP